MVRACSALLCALTKKAGKSPPTRRVPFFLFLILCGGWILSTPFSPPKTARPPGEIQGKTRAANIVERRGKISDNTEHEKNIVLRNRSLRPHVRRPRGRGSRESAARRTAPRRLRRKKDAGQLHENAVVARRGNAAEIRGGHGNHRRILHAERRQGRKRGNGKGHRRKDCRRNNSPVAQAFSWNQTEH